MKVTEKLIAEVIGNVVGDDAVRMAMYIRDKKDVSEFKLAAYLKEDIQVVRHMLYRLHAQNLATYKRKKDRKKGWYVSYWTFNKSRVKELVGSIRNKKLAHFKERLSTETANVNNFYLCPKACVRMDFHNAIQMHFKCPECGTVMEQQDNTKTIDFLKEQIREMETEAGTV